MLSPRMCPSTSCACLKSFFGARRFDVSISTVCQWNECVYRSSERTQRCAIYGRIVERTTKSHLSFNTLSHFRPNDISIRHSRYLFKHKLVSCAWYMLLAHSSGALMFTVYSTHQMCLCVCVWINAADMNITVQISLIDEFKLGRTTIQQIIFIVHLVSCSVPTSRAYG